MKTMEQFEDRLLAELLGVHSELSRVPSASSHHRARHVAIGGTAAVLAAAAVVVALGGGDGGGTSRHQSSNRPHTPTTPLQTVAFKVRQALTTASTDSVEYSVVTSNTPGQSPEVSDMWSRGGSARVESFNPDGSVATDFSATTTAGSNGTVPTCTVNAVNVDYSRSEYFPVSVTVLDANPGPPEDVAAEIQQDLADGQLTNDGTTVVDGQTVIELTGSAVTAGVPAAQAKQAIDCVDASGGAGGGGSGGTGESLQVTIYVDPTTYLPVQNVVTGDGWDESATISWLPATPANLALLAAPIPPGFTAEPGSSAIKSHMTH
ncbi:MAG TPA: hypothetical protein VGS21_11435 [Acidimicrobiales bacterium]|nr:hypothetical protein [Acidimicrobiales bacterium]